MTDTAHHHTDRSTAELIRDLSEQTARLVRDETRLALHAPVPERTVASVREDVEVLKGRAHR